MIEPASSERSWAKIAGPSVAERKKEISVGGERDDVHQAAQALRRGELSKMTFCSVSVSLELVQLGLLARGS